MALIKCPECNKEISDTAKRCPNCGYKFPIKNKKNICIIILVIIAIVIIVSGSLLYIHSQPLYKYKHQIIETLNDYKNDTISYDTAYKKINTIESQVNREYEKEKEKDLSKSIKLNSLKVTISGITLELIKSHSYGYYGTKLDEYISELKK